MRIFITYILLLISFRPIQDLVYLIRYKMKLPKKNSGWHPFSLVCIQEWSWMWSSSVLLILTSSALKFSKNKCLVIVIHPNSVTITGCLDDLILEVSLFLALNYFSQTWCLICFISLLGTHAIFSTEDCQGDFAIESWVIDFKVKFCYTAHYSHVVDRW